MTEQLKQCPFCGGTDIRAHVYGGGEPDAFMQCHDCSADGPNGLNRAGAIEAWNRRAQPAQAVPPTHVLVPVEPDEMWAYQVIRHHQPDLEVGGTAWLECLKEMLHWHAAIAQQKGQP